MGVSLDNHQLVRDFWRGNLVLNNGLTRDTAADIIRSGEAQAVSFGRPFIANPDLVSRLRRNTPLAPHDEAKVYTPGAAGYVDYPFATG